MRIYNAYILWPMSRQAWGVSSTIRRVAGSNGHASEMLVLRAVEIGRSQTSSLQVSDKGRPIMEEG